MHPFFQFPAPLIQIIESLCLKESGHLSDDQFIAHFSPHIKKLSDHFNRIPGGEAGSRSAAFPEFPVAYAAYFLPSNLLKVSALLLDLQNTYPDHPFFSPGGKAVFKDRPFRVLDLGAGPGTNGLGLLDFAARFPEPYFSGLAIEYIGVDQNAQTLGLLPYLLSAYQKRIETALIERNIRFSFQAFQKRIPAQSLGETGKFDLIILGNVINEMIRDGNRIDSLAKWIGELIRRLTPDGALLIIEPALKKCSRDLLEMRDRIAVTRSAQILGPCLHQNICPIMGPLGSEKDWCHQEKEWLAPEWIQKIDRHIGNRKESLKYSYLVLSPKRMPPLDPSVWWRTVSEVIETKGKKEAFFCNEDGRVRFYLLDREVTESNRSFWNIRRGDLVQIHRTDETGKHRILPRWNLQIR